jgi:hypothetical protein
MNRLVLATSLSLALLGCKKESSSVRNDPAAPLPAGGGAAPANPHAGADMGGGAPANPHAGMNIGGDPSNPHGGGAGGVGMAGGGGGTTLKATADGKRELGSFVIEPGKTWVEAPTSSSMRAAQWSLPGAGGAADAELVVYYFGTGGAGGVDANLDRWLGQFQQPDGSASKDKATIAQVQVAGQKATTVEVEGRYVAAVTPGASETVDNPAWKLVGAIVESPEGPYYFKLIGPKSTVDAHGDEFHGMISGMKLAGGGAAAAAKPADDGAAKGGW